MDDRLQKATGGAPGRGDRFGRWIAGRARRREYWAWMAPIFLLELLLAVLGPVGAIVAGLLRTLIWIRRLHDLGLTGWLVVAFNIGTNALSFALLAFADAGNAALITSLVVCAMILVMGVIPGQANANRFGPPPGRKSELGETFA